MEAGDRFGSYELIDRLGQGGMGEVWRARHELLARQAAVKLIRLDALGLDVGGTAAAGIMKRFEREAQATSGLRSPHTIELYDFGVSSDGTFYYAMELLEGLSLRELVDQYGPLEPARAIYVLRQLCDSLAEAHHAGLVHRDIKPANVYLCRLGLQHDFTKVLDFGLVKREPTGGAQQTALTAAGVAPGSPAFMAPELAQSPDAVDGRADIYAVGCVAYWLLTGTLLFEHDSPLEVVVAHVREPPALPSSRTELEIPDDLETLVMECLAKSPVDRPQSAREFKNRLGQCAAAGQWSAERADEWWAKHKPAVTFETLNAVGGDAVELAKQRRDSVKVEQGEAAVSEGTAGATPAGESAAEIPESASPRAPHIPTDVAFEPLEKTDAMSVKRDQMRSVLQHHFTRSHIDLDDLERRLVLIRRAETPKELESVVGDLDPVERIRPTPVPEVEHPNRARSGLPVSAMRSDNIIAVFGGNERKGRWVVPELMRITTVFGGCDLDFRDAIFESPQAEVKCACVFGGVDIIVPPDIHVVVKGIGVFGGFSQSGSRIGLPGPGVPTLIISGAAVFGGVDIKVKQRGEKSTMKQIEETVKKLLSGK